jgi:protoporphyrinogen oxidase
MTQSNTLDPGLIILGGGLAGMAASLSTGAPVYEAEPYVGGVAASDTTDGFTFDRGIHVLQTRNERALSLFSDVGIEFETHSRRASIYFQGKYTEYPFQVNTAGLPIGLRARCVWGFLRRGNEPAPTNYEEWINRSVGRGFASTFLIPYSEKFWTVHPRDMTFEWTSNRVPQPSTWQVLRGMVWNKQTNIGTNASFRYPRARGGYGSIANALARRGGDVHLKHRAVRIDTATRTVHFDNGTHARYATMISSIPLPDLVGLCQAAPESVRDAARQLRTNSILVVNFGIDRADVSNRHWVHFPEKEFSFFRISFPHNFSDATAPPGTSSISAEVAYSDREPCDAAAVAARVREDLIRAGILRRDDTLLTTTTRNIKYAYCIYDRPRTEALRVIHQWMRSQGIVSCGRYGLWTYFWSDEAILSGLKAGESALRRTAELSSAAVGS